MKVILILFTLSISSTILTQGFYVGNDFFINQKIINELSIKTVTGTSDYKNDDYHPLSNFIFEYYFDSSGNIVKRKEWKKNHISNRIIKIRLGIDTSIYIKEANEFAFVRLYESKEVKFNQNKERTKEYINSFFNKFDYIEKVNYLNRGGIIGGINFLQEFDFFNVQVSIPSWIINEYDSIYKMSDTIKVYQSKNDFSFLSKKIYRTTNNEIRIDYIDPDLEKKYWASSFINNKGFLYKEERYIYTELYFYDDRGLHIKSERFGHNQIMSMTKYNYK